MLEEKRSRRNKGSSNRVNKNEPEHSEYECDLCGMKFGNSLGDMELHKTIVHFQNDVKHTEY